MERKLKGSYRFAWKLKGHYMSSLVSTTGKWWQPFNYCPFNFQAVEDRDNFLLTSL